ncbi:MAG TPA: response regulator transcription factor [Solirubrobacterales bacterium]|nr:response regulator transcription factor [Solirubrobacterales bacterium]
MLVVDDDPIVRDVLDRYLSREGFLVKSAGDGKAALEAVEAGRPDLVLLDLMLPRIDGFEVFRHLRESGDRPAVIMLTARGQETDRVIGLESGADDYVAKPFSPREVVARVRAVLRRTSPDEGTAAAPTRIKVGSVEIDPGSREAQVDGAPVSLTRREFDLLRFFAEHPRIVFSRLQLLDQLWDVAYAGDTSTVTVHVRRLREKIEADPSQPRRLVTVWGAGYRFDP